MKLSKELLEKAKEAKSVEELLEIAKAENIELSAEEAAKYFAELNKTGELSDEELDNVSGGGLCRDYEASGDKPKFNVGDRLGMVHPVIGRQVAVEITYVSSVKSCKRGVNVFTYNAKSLSNGDLFTDIAEFDFGKVHWVK